MVNINLDLQDKKVKEFVRSLSGNGRGFILELEGKAVLKVMPIETPVNEAKLKAAIRKRRDRSRELNQEWQGVDQELWDKMAETLVVDWPPQVPVPSVTPAPGEEVVYAAGSVSGSP